MMRIGVISDTHGLLRAEAVAALQGCDNIVHGGDIGDEDILVRLAAIAPVTAVRGNNDTQPWAASLAETERLRFDEVGVYLLHDLKQLAFRPEEHGIHVVVSGHSHRPSVEEYRGVLYVNPGSAGPRRFRLPVCVAELTVTARAVSARIIELPVAGGP